MEALKIEIINPKALKLIQGMEDLAKLVDEVRSSKNEK